MSDPSRNSLCAVYRHARRMSRQAEHQRQAAYGATLPCVLVVVGDRRGSALDGVQSRVGVRVAACVGQPPCTQRR